MENMVRQKRVVKFSGSGDDSKPNNIRERIPPQKAEKKKAQNWLGMQLSRHSSSDSSSSDGEFETAMAASAFAITSLEEVDSPNKKRAPAEAPEISLTKAKSRKEDNLAGPSRTGNVSNRFTENVSMKKQEATDQKPAENASINQRMPEKVMDTVSSVRRTRTFSETYPNDDAIVKSENAKGTISKPSVSFNEKPTAPTPNNRNQLGNSKENREAQTKADAWEKAQMAKIDKRYEKLMGEILSRENKKQIKARHQLERKEKKLGARAQQEYCNEMARINKITGDARAIAEERKRNDEVKTKEKAEIIRTTGKIPVTCFCF